MSEFIKLIVSMGNIQPIWLIIIVSIIAFIPLLLGLATSFVKASIILGILKNALGLQQVPGMIAEASLSLVITTFVMTPVLEKVFFNIENVGEISLKKIPQKEEIAKLLGCFTPWKDFLVKNADNLELIAVARISKEELIKPEELSLRSTLAAFFLTELKEAFIFGFSVLLPFLVIDLIVSNILAGLGIYMVSPQLISLPLKLLLFVTCNGWLKITEGIVLSYQT